MLRMRLQCVLCARGPGRPNHGGIAGPEPDSHLRCRVGLGSAPNDCDDQDPFDQSNGLSPEAFAGGRPDLNGLRVRVPGLPERYLVDHGYCGRSRTQRPVPDEDAIQEDTGVGRIPLALGRRRRGVGPPGQLQPNLFRQRRYEASGHQPRGDGQVPLQPKAALQHAPLLLKNIIDGWASVGREHTAMCNTEASLPPCHPCAGPPRRTRPTGLGDGGADRP
jgi:hypothetical protein